MSVIQKYAILNDVHFPFECRSRYAVALKILESIKNLTGIYLNGDIMEFLGVSRWPTSPKDRINFAEELDYGNKKFDELCDKFQDVPVTYICGNHEDRFYRYVRDIAPQMWGAVPGCPELLKFQDRPYWRFVDYSTDQLVQLGKSKLWLRHEPLGGGPNPAKTTAEKSVVDIAFAHVHIFQSYTHRKFGPSPFLVKAYSCGWLGDKSRTVFDYRGPKENWNEGITIVEVEAKSGDYNLEFVSLEKLPALYDGKLYTAKP